MKQGLLEFGSLAKRKRNYDIKTILQKNNKDLDYLFNDTKKRLKELNIAEVERQAAMENLRALTTQLQTRRLRNKVKSSCKYFTL